MSRFLAAHPRFLLIALLAFLAAGAVSLRMVGLADYPEVAPTVVSVSTTYAGAGPQVVADTVAVPIETEINKVDNVVYFESTCNDSGSYSLNVTFAAGSDPDINLVNVQNAVKRAESKLPGEVVQVGINSEKAQVDTVMLFAFTAKNPGDDLHLLGNAVCKELKEALQRIDGVSKVSSSASGEYAMRVWIDPVRLDSLGISVAQLKDAIASQNIQPAAGSVGTAFSSDFLSYKINVRGRLVTTEEFESIVIRADPNTGARVLLGDVAHCQLGSQNYLSEPRNMNRPAFQLGIYRDPSANSVEISRRCREKVAEWMSRLPVPADCAVCYDTTDFTRAFTGGILRNLLIAAGVLMVLLIVISLVRRDGRQLVRALVLPPVAVTGASIALCVCGFTFNSLTAVSFVFALGVVAFDVVGNGHRRSVSHSLFSSLVAAAGLVPLCFYGGMLGIMYAQFAIVYAVSALCSGLAVIFLSLSFDSTVEFHIVRPRGRMGPCAVRVALSLGLIVACSGFIGIVLPRLGTEFVPEEDRGRFLVEMELTEGSSLMRAHGMIDKAYRLIEGMEGVANVFSSAGNSNIGRIGENRGTLDVKLVHWGERARKGLDCDRVIADFRRRISGIHNASVMVLKPPAMNGFGTYGGVVAYLCAVAPLSASQRSAGAEAYAAELRRSPLVASADTTFSANTPMLRLDVDREKAKALGVDAATIFSTLQSELASFYVNDFNVRGGAYQVIVQSDYADRSDFSDVLGTRIASAGGAMVPLSSFASLRHELGPRVVNRYNKLPSAGVVIMPAEGVSSLQIVDLVKSNPPDERKYVIDWSPMTLQEIASRGRFGHLASVAVLLVYLVLVVGCESWRRALIQVVPSAVSVASAVCAMWLLAFPVSIYSQLALLFLLGFSIRFSFGNDWLDLFALGVFAAALLPLVFSVGIGSSAQRAIVIPVIGGLAALAVFVCGKMLRRYVVREDKEVNASVDDL